MRYKLKDIQVNINACLGDYISPETRTAYALTAIAMILYNKNYPYDSKTGDKLET